MPCWRNIANSFGVNSFFHSSSVLIIFCLFTSLLSHKKTFGARNNAKQLHSKFEDLKTFSRYSIFLYLFAYSSLSRLTLRDKVVAGGPSS